MLEPGFAYHIYNSANGSEDLFRENRNYDFFISKFLRYIDPVADIYAYCMLRNHFHAMIQVRNADEIVSHLEKQGLSEENDFDSIGGIISRQFSNLFNSYAKAFNKTYCRRGSLFQRPFKYKKVDSDVYFTQLILYIHNNPVKHGFVDDAREWPHSSLHLFDINSGLSGFKNPNRSEFKINRDAVIKWFGGLEQFKEAHGVATKLRSVFD